MSKDLNKWQGIGRLGNDPEIRYTADGKAVASLTIACGDDYKDKQGNKVEHTEWVRISAFGRLAEIIGEYLKKGSQVYIEGKLRTNKWQDKDGQDRYTTEILANELQMLGGKSESGGFGATTPNARGGATTAQGGERYSPPGGQPNFEDFDDEIPF